MGRIHLEIKLEFSKGSTSIDRSFSRVIEVTGDQFFGHRQSIATGGEIMQLGDVATGGWCIAINRDPTNYVEIKFDNAATNLIQLETGECACFRTAVSSVPTATADTAAVELEYIIIEA
jgi:hypothetical protein